MQIVLHAVCLFWTCSLLEAPILKLFLYLFGCFVLAYTGIESLSTAGKISTNQFRNRESLRKSFSTGFLMSISNPLSILFWLGIYGSVLAKSVQTVDSSQLIFNSSAIFIGLFIWDIAMAGLASTFQKIIDSKFLTLISYFSGLSLIGFSIYFGFEAYKMIF